jgi:hypothetical protein
MDRVQRVDIVLMVALPVLAAVLALVAVSRLWLLALFLWWLGLAALPSLMAMARLTHGRQALLVLLLGLSVAALSCATIMTSIDQCGAACTFGVDPS